jgi:hypothetical protein
VPEAADREQFRDTLQQADDGSLEPAQVPGSGSGRDYLDMRQGNSPPAVIGPTAAPTAAVVVVTERSESC